MAVTTVMNSLTETSPGCEDREARSQLSGWDEVFSFEAEANRLGPPSVIGYAELYICWLSSILVLSMSLSLDLLHKFIKLLIKVLFIVPFTFGLDCR